VQVKTKVPTTDEFGYG